MLFFRACESDFCSCVLSPFTQTEFSSVALTHSGLSMEELRIVEGQGQSSEVITPSEEMNRINDMGKNGLKEQLVTGAFLQLACVCVCV